MPDFWQFPTVSMGLGPIMAIYQARFMRYLTDRGIARHLEAQGLVLPRRRRDRRARVARRDRPGRPREALQPRLRRQLQPAAPRRPGPRQRQDHPGAGDDLPRRRLERDQGDLGQTAGTRCSRPTATACSCAAWRRRSTASTRPTRPATAPSCASTSSASTRSWPKRVEDMIGRGDLGPEPRRPRRQEGLRRLRGGPGRDPAADRDPRQDDQGLRDGRGRRGPEHHPPAEEDERGGAARSSATASSSRSPTTRSETSPTTAARGLATRSATCASAARRSAATCPPRRRARGRAAPRAPARRSSSPSSTGTGDREISTTMAFVRILAALLRDKEIGPRVVPIVPDESRTFGMEGMFRQLGIYSHVGQLYEPEDAGQLMFYREDRKGQVLQEGINEAGAFSSWIAAATSLLEPRHADDPVLRLLLDVRLPAGRRPRLGGGRLARARLPDRRHRRADDAERRGPPARGRAQPRARRDDPQLRRLRPGLRLRAGRDRPRRACGG